MHIIDSCLLLELEKCSCLAIYSYFSGGAETASVAQSGKHSPPMWKVAGSKPRTFFMNLSSSIVFHCYKYENILSFLHCVSVFSDITCLLIYFILSFSKERRERKNHD